ncbi:hypothetical protein [Macrococcus lamae]|uniref:Uncharacterized protein n=1 Tax=Macrococcus lamae TaxID=198484 RepID=A0A4R6BVV1_9STAP|nr:hypothetical protein [Macrococcus lamae]TDM12295.1 hypothetical protein ERX29_04325 [Macrococcus lamae]
MTKSDLTIIIMYILVLIMNLLTLPPLLSEGVTVDNIFPLVMVGAMLSMISSTLTNHFTNTMDREDQKKIYPPEVVKKWSRINIGAQIIVILFFLSWLIYVIVKFPAAFPQILLCIAWIVLCLFNIYREIKRQRYVTANP